MTDVIGPSFFDELAEAGLNGLPFSWGSDGSICGRENLTAEQNNALDAVLAAHNPTRKTIADVKAEAYRRIVAICPEWKQRNLTAQVTQLLRKGETNWTQAETAAWDAGQAIWDQIDAIRTKSDEIEGMDPIPDITKDETWS